MLSEVKKSLPVDLAVCTAAVADFKPVEKSKNKIKKDELDFKSINFIKNNDILNFLSKNNKNRPQIVAGFSAETKNVIKNSTLKLKIKIVILFLLMMFLKKTLVLIPTLIKFQ